MSIAGSAPRMARRIEIRGTVQGVGFRPYIYRLARAYALSGWVINGDDGVVIHVEGQDEVIDAFVRAIGASVPPAARVAHVTIRADRVEGHDSFQIRASESDKRPSTRIAPDLPVCDECLREMGDPQNRRYRYPYINCTNCGPRFSIVRSLPYDRHHTTMVAWPLCGACAAEYQDPANRRFHAQPVACPVCGPGYQLVRGELAVARGHDAVTRAAALLRAGCIVGVKGLGGYHLACDATNAPAVQELRARKYRKEQAFALMVRDLAVAERTVELTSEARSLLTSISRPIVVAPSRVELTGVAPENRDFGVMLPYAPVHVLLFGAGAPERLVMTSGNRSSEPIAYRDEDAVKRLNGLADALLVGERPIARRVDDSVMRVGPFGPSVQRRGRGLAPGVVAELPASKPMLALGGDLKNAITLVVDGQAYVSQHIGDLSHTDARYAFIETARDLLNMYAVQPHELTVVHDCHPEYYSAAHASELEARQTIAVQHHRAHVASVLAEHNALDRRALGVAFDGTGYGDDGSIWGGEIFVGSVGEGFTRVAHLRPAALVGGDAAATHPVQAAAGFLAQVDVLPDLTRQPFAFPRRYGEARAVLASGTGTRVFATTSVGRLFDAVAALLGFTRPITFEGQAAMWLEHLATMAHDESTVFSCRTVGNEIDWRDMLSEIVDARRRGLSPALIARAFHRTLGRTTAETLLTLAQTEAVDTAVLSGGVMQNQLLLADLRDALAETGIELWTNQRVPPNDGGLSLGQAALACLAS